MLRPVSAALLISASASAGSLELFVNDVYDYDYGRQLSLPQGFGAAEFTLEVWVRPTPLSVGADRRTQWTPSDPAPNSTASWWWDGNFLLDGHNNSSSSTAPGTFDLQVYGGGRVRWLFADGTAPGPSFLYGVQSSTASSPRVLDGQWHRVACVRRWANPGASLELWVDGLLVKSVAVPARVDMRQFWSSWSGFPSNERGWYWGAEKQVARNAISEWDSYHGRIDELRFWSVARAASELAAPPSALSGSEPGLAGWFTFSEGAGTSTCDRLNPSQCISLQRLKSGAWSTDEALPSGAPGQPALTLSASPAALPPGATATLTWSGANVTSCLAAGGWSGPRAPQGSQAVGAGTFTLTCSGPGGSVTRAVTVTVEEPPPPPPSVLVYSCPDLSLQGASAYDFSDCPSWSWSAPSAGLVASCGGPSCSWSGMPVRWYRLADVQPSWQVSACLAPTTPGSQACSNDAWAPRSSL